MAEITTPSSTKNQTNVEFENEGYDEDCENLTQESKELILSLPREKGWISPYLYLYKDVWVPALQVQAICFLQKNFQAIDDDIVIASTMKSGTAWLKGLVFAIVNRKVFSPSQKNHPLLVSNPHVLIQSFEFNYFGNNEIPNLSHLPKPRIFSTHIPFHLLPDSIAKSKCKIIYICRNPFDTFVSLWFFANKVKASSASKLSLDEAFEKYSKGINEFGPFWTNMLGYWRESKHSPRNILFLRYEDLKADIKFWVKRVADFLDCPFNSEEENNDGVIDNIIELCSFQKMKDLEVNKTGKFHLNKAGNSGLQIENIHI